MNPKVSIVIPVYNGEDYMREAIDSALAQTYDNCEIIVVNDGSTDNTDMIARSYGDKIRYFSKKNGGVSSALNVGIENMEGEYFQYLPHDDLLHSDKIEKNIRAIQQSGNDMSIVWSGWNYNYMDGRGLRRYQIPYRFMDLKKLTNSVFPLLFSLINTVTVLISKQYFKKVGNFNTNLYTSQDYDMWTRTFINQRTVYISEELVDYRIHKHQGTQEDPEFIRNCIITSENMVSSLTEIQIKTMFGNQYKFLYHMLDFYRDQGWADSYKKMFEQFKDCEEPIQGEEERHNLQKYLKTLGYTGDNLVLYCAGKNTKNLIWELRTRNINIRALSDSDKNKVGMKINGVICIEPGEIEKKRDLVLVTKDDPENVVSNLQKQGMRNIVSYKEIGNIIYNTSPTKELYETVKI